MEGWGDLSVSNLKLVLCRDSRTSQHSGDVLNRNNTILRWETDDEGGGEKTDPYDYLGQPVPLLSGGDFKED